MAFREILALFSIPPGSPCLPHLPIRQRKQNGVKAEYVLRREEEETSLKKLFNSQSFRWGGFPGPWKTLKRQISGKGDPFSRGVLTQAVGPWERLRLSGSRGQGSARVALGSCAASGNAASRAPS